jgi:WD40 repeat protein
MGNLWTFLRQRDKKIADSSIAKDEDANVSCSDLGVSSPEGDILGVEVSVQSQHRGIIGDEVDDESKARRSSGVSFGGIGLLKKGSTFLTSKTSSMSSEDSHQESAKKSLKESVSSIAMLGDGYFLTAAVADLNIKMWRLTRDDTDGRASVTFIRNFSGCKTGVTSLTKVDRKGRFLSGSKSGTVMLWDSRFNCNDCKNMEQLEENQVLLATFDKLERRRVDSIAIIEEGSYVRPTDNVDWSMMAAMTKKAAKEGSNAVQRAAQERQIISCSCDFASITGASRSVKIWSVTHVDKNADNEGALSEGGNVAEAKLSQKLEHDNVVESVATLSGKSMLLAGDRMGCVTLWKGFKNVFKRGSPKVWQSIRVFNWRHKHELHKIKECMQFGITSLSFLGDGYFVSGARGGDLRVWNVNGSGAKDETVHKELIGLSGAHSTEVTSIITGRGVIESSSKEKMMTLFTCGKDGMVLSFVVPAEKPIPRSYNALNIGICGRYASEGESVSALSLGCLEEGNNTKLIVGGSCGSINILPQPHPSFESQDALLAYRQKMRDESFTLQLIAENACNTIKCTDHKKHMYTYSNCFRGSDLVTYLVDGKHAVTRNDAVLLARALQKHLSLFTHVSKEFELLRDDIRSFYRFRSEFKKNQKKFLQKRTTM